MLCGVFLAWVVKEASQVIVPCASGENLLLVSAYERRVLHSDLKRPLVRNVWSSSLPLMVLGLAVMGFAELFMTRLPCRKLRALKFRA